jgi:hypothetical protein
LGKPDPASALAEVEWQAISADLLLTGSSPFDWSLLGFCLLVSSSLRLFLPASSFFCSSFVSHVFYILLFVINFFFVDLYRITKRPLRVLVDEVD